MRSSGKSLKEGWGKVFDSKQEPPEKSLLQDSPREGQDWTPEYITRTLKLLHARPGDKITDKLLRQHDISPVSVRRWFRQRHGMTFHAFQRAQRMRVAKEAIQQGKQVTEVAFNSGYESLSGFGTAFRNVIGESPEESKP